MRVVRPAARTVGREQGVLAHQAQQPLAGDADGVAHAQPGPDLARAPSQRAAMGTCRYPSPVEGEVSRSRLMAASKASSLMAGLGPRRAGGAAGMTLFT
jgi:hypothetical protein